MIERPILFSGPMVRAILGGSKTQTRRVVKFTDMNKEGQPMAHHRWKSCFTFPDGTWGWNDIPNFLPDEKYFKASRGPGKVCRQGMPGDRLWVRETHYLFGYWIPVTGNPKKKFTFLYERGKGAKYLGESVIVENGKTRKPGWYRRPSIFMPRWASRITLEITDVRVQRLQTINDADAQDEGIRELPLQENQPGAWWTADASKGSVLHGRTPSGAFIKLWDSINAKRMPWASNPWCWAISFRRIDQ